MRGNIMNTIGHLYNIQHFSLDDGPGIRTTFFLKGCNLRCPWCHNPEGMQPQPSLLYNPKKCIACKSCLNVCTSGAHVFANGNHYYNREKCELCFACTSFCPTGSLEKAGFNISPPDLLSESLVDQVFYNVSGGGVTFSGGEPLLQSLFLSECMTLIKENGIHVSVETSCSIPRKNLDLVKDFTDLFLIDIKSPYPEYYRTVLNGNLQLVINNINYLLLCNKKIIIRVPLIKGFNVSGTIDETWEKYLELFQSFNGVQQIDLLPYHRYGENKYELLNMECKTNAEQLLTDDELFGLFSSGINLNLPMHCEAIDK